MFGFGGFYGVVLFGLIVFWGVFHSIFAWFHGVFGSFIVFFGGFIVVLNVFHGVSDRFKSLTSYSGGLGAVFQGVPWLSYMLTYMFSDVFSLLAFPKSQKPPNEIPTTNTSGSVCWMLNS